MLHPQEPTFTPFNLAANDRGQGFSNTSQIDA